ncbi:spn-E [Drosophila busckii]|uniref:Probable ATP-dependent RNA helicase spindle-E n=1 Tax=Drosophila busckii TaxID=30019 RepID=A0A0M3QUM6_DROBS|nr:probable ATP-dependent RNA helicase spindle-E [Drosophila busckii]ALC40893.1 spn-E [Drosophila busckii]
MDNPLDFFDFSKDFKRGVQPKGCITGDKKVLARPTRDSKPLKREISGTEYINKFVEREKKLLDNLVDGSSVSKRHALLDDLDSDEDAAMEELPTVRSDEAYYERFTFDLNRNRSLPIYEHRDEIISAIRENPVVILKGETGCGKSTQVPQYILDEAYKRREYCNIVVTQPRRIAAISIARRVCQERKWQPGTVCSYQVGLHRESDQADTRLLYCTTGVLLNILVKQKTLTHFTHILLDEVHERDQDMDFLLIVVRRLLALNSRHVKVILMSATIDTREFSKYFATSHSQPPIVTASHGRKYPLSKFYRDQLKNIHWKDPVVQMSEPGITPEGYADATKILVVIDNMERKAEGQSQQSYEEAKRIGSVLVFLPGVREIDIMEENIKCATEQYSSSKITIVKCHSLMAPDVQAEVFQPPLPGHRKVILTTNIAESSITVPDVSYVIDFCLVKVLHIDTATNFTSLRLEWASKVNCRQRAGRVGRVRSGRVYRMVTKAFYVHEMKEFGLPEMLRAPLQNAVIRAKLLEMGRPSELLALAMSPPNLSDVQNTVLLLKEVGALFPTVDGIYDELDGDLSYWGKIMSRLPLDVRLSRLIILGYIFNCLDEAIIIAAGMSVRSIFLFSKRGEINNAFWMQQTFCDGSESDLVAIWRVYKAYLNMCQDRMFKEAEGQWARRFGLNLSSVKEMHLMVQVLRKRCALMNLHVMPFEACQNWNDQDKAIILNVIIAGAFYPNYFVRTNKSSVEQERSVYQTICGHDPCRTVFFSNFVPRAMGELYTRRIKELFAQLKIPRDNMDVTFQSGSEKVFVTFKESADNGESSMAAQAPGRVMSEVYKAVRMRLANPLWGLGIMEHSTALRYVRQHRIGEVRECTWIPPSKPWNVELVTLPSVFDKIISGRITHRVNCSKFYFQPHALKESIASMSDIFNAPQQLKNVVRDARSITKGLQLLANRGRGFQRALVLKVESQTKSQPKFLVRFIDYGDTALLPIELLRLMPDDLKSEFDELPPRMFECRLALVRPASIVSWPKAADEMLDSVARCGIIELEVYSLVNNVAAVMIHMQQGLLNDKLVERQWARRADEDYMSRKDHDFRVRKQATKRFVSLVEQKHINEEYLRFVQLPQDLDLEPPPLDRCDTSVRLKGPFSPLETTISALVRIGAHKSVTIGNESVNAVLLDTDPHDRHDQTMVAAFIADSGDRLYARGTSLMPNIHGFGALMTLLFCPTMQIKCNKEKTKYVSILAGLGYDPVTLNSYFEEHDMVVNLDVVIDKADLTVINQMRYHIVSMLYDVDGDEYSLPGLHDRALIFKQLRALLFRLLNKNRRFIERHVSHSDYKWKDMSDLEPPSEPYGKRTIFPMHCSYDLEDEKMGTLLSLQSNCKELYNWRNFDGAMQPLRCMLCNEMLENVTELRLHLLTILHLDREKQIGYSTD